MLRIWKISHPFATSDDHRDGGHLAFAGAMLLGGGGAAFWDSITQFE